MTDRVDVPMMFHPTLAVPDLEAARTWFERVFQRPSVRWEERYDLNKINTDYPVNYSFFVHVADVIVDALCPTLFTAGSHAAQERYRGITQGMSGLGWWTNDVSGVVDRLAASGIRCHDQTNKVITGGRPAPSSMAPDIFLAFTMPEDVGFRYEFFELGERHRSFYSIKGDPRLRPDWTLPPPADDDPLQIVRGAHHTFLTLQLDRALELYVDALGGSVRAEGHNSELDSDSVFVEFADSVLEFAVPRRDSVGAHQVSADRDHYYGITFEVRDLQMVAEHLDRMGIAPRRGEQSLSIAPENGFGAEWRFVGSTAD